MATILVPNEDHGSVYSFLGERGRIVTSPAGHEVRNNAGIVGALLENRDQTFAHGSDRWSGILSKVQRNANLTHISEV